MDDRGNAAPTEAFVREKKTRFDVESRTVKAERVGIDSEKSVGLRKFVKANYDHGRSTSGDPERWTSGAWGEPGTGAAGAPARPCTRAVQQEETVFDLRLRPRAL